MSKQTEQRVRGWCFTDFEMNDEFYEGVKEKCVYLIYGKETCPDTGRLHYQGYVYWRNPRTFGGVQKEFRPRNIRIARGTAEQNKEYCSKDGEVQEYGVMPKAGERTDIQMMREAVKEGKGARELVEMTDSYQAFRMAEKILQYKEKKRAWKTEVFWYWGPTGTGKSHQAHEEAGEDAWTSGVDGKWFQDYDANENAIFDDFRGDWCKFHTLLRLLDKYPYTVEVKGSSRQWVPRKLWVTSPYHPKDVYMKGTEDTKQLLRRIDVVKHFTEVWDAQRMCTEVGGNTSPPPSHAHIEIGGERPLM